MKGWQHTLNAKSVYKNKIKLLHRKFITNQVKKGSLLAQSRRPRHKLRVVSFKCLHGIVGFGEPLRFVISELSLSASVEVSLGRQGRLVIPAPWRRALELEEGDRLVARQEAGRLVLEKPDRVKKRLKARFARVAVERALVDELIAERREHFCLEDSRPESM